MGLKHFGREKSNGNIFRAAAAFLAAVLLVFAMPHAASPLDFSKKFVQKADAAFFRSLLERPGEPRALFFEFSGAPRPVPLYAVYSADKNAVRVFGKIGPFADGLLADDFKENSAREIFETRRRDGSVFYARGKCLRALSRGGAKPARVTYVPYSPGAAFISDAGYLEILFDRDDILARRDPAGAVLAALRTAFKSESVRLSPAVEYNRYYFDRPDYFGYVNPASGEPERGAFAPLYPTHKMTQNRRIASSAQKASLDVRDAVRYLSRDYPLISQDLRAKGGAVEAGTRLDLGNEGQTDIGSGQNMFVYVSYGPGINYYDSPYGDTAPVAMSPRFIFSDDILWRRFVQFFPKNSWETRGQGTARYDEINRFQASLSAAGSASSGRSPESAEPGFMSESVREKYLGLMTSTICRYGLMNSGTELLADFEFAGERHRGNPVNNEVRCLDAVYPAYSSCAMIVPAGMRPAYLREYESAVAARMAPERPGGTFYPDYFIEAACTGEAGMRAAYLEHVLFMNDASLYRLVRRARKGGGAGAYLRTATAAAGTIERDAEGFFGSPSARGRRARYRKCVSAYRDYLEAVRTGRGGDAEKRLFSRYARLYDSFYHDADGVDVADD